MSIIPEDKLELLKSGFNSIFEDVQAIENVHEILGGADTRILAADIHTPAKVIPVVVRLYRNNSGQRAEWEFNLLKQIHKAGVYTPKPYFFDTTDPNWSFYTMQRIEGVNFAERLLAMTDGQDTLLSKYYSVMANLHEIDPALLPILRLMEPQESLIWEINKTKKFIEEYQIDELSGIIDYLEKELDHISFTSRVVLHGDFHANNVLITDSDDLFLVDWANVYLGDFRIDLAFSITAFNSAMGDMTNMFVKIYESISGKSVKQIEFFMVLSNLFNVLRFYSCAVNHEITSESENTKKVFFEDIKFYTSYITKMVCHITGVELPSIQNNL